MLDIPDDLGAFDLLIPVLAGWGLAWRAHEHLAVGFGSHHWRVVDQTGTPWFVTVDDLRSMRRSPAEPLRSTLLRLQVALRTAEALRVSGLEFVVAPIPMPNGSVVAPVGDHYAVAVYPWIEGTPFGFRPYASADERATGVELVTRLHQATDTLEAHPLPDDLLVPERDELEDALDDLDEPWETGPYAERARLLLAEHEDDVRSLLASHDELALSAMAEPERDVITHGEPHIANMIDTADGWVLVDWETCRMAPPERDLWRFEAGDDLALARYVAATGRSLRPELLRLYRQWADLADIAIAVRAFRADHTLTQDLAKSWVELSRLLGG